MDENACQMPTPAPEHEQLLKRVGTWDVACTYFMDPSQPPMQNTAKETVEAVGGFWTISCFEADFMGAPFVGRCTMGYDPRKEKYVATWVDSMSNMMFLMEGRYDDEGKVLTMRHEGPIPGTEHMTTWRSTHEELDGGKFKFEMFFNTPDGNEAKSMSYIYTRAQ